MPTPISDHTVPWPDAAAADYVARGYWAGARSGALPPRRRRPTARRARPRRRAAGCG